MSEFITDEDQKKLELFRQALEKEGLSPDEVKRALEPLESFYLSKAKTEDFGKDLKPGDTVWAKLTVERVNPSGDVKCVYSPRPGYEEYASSVINAIFLWRGQEANREVLQDMYEDLIADFDKHVSVTPGGPASPPDWHPDHWYPVPRFK